MARERNEQVNEAGEEYEYLTGIARLRRIAFLRSKYERDYISGMSYAKETGLEEGRAEGRVKGHAEGRAEGRAEGKAEEQKEIAKKMLEEKMDIELIEKITGLSKEEIEKMK